MTTTVPLGTFIIVRDCCHKSNVISGFGPVGVHYVSIKRNIRCNMIVYCYNCAVYCYTSMNKICL